MRHAHIRPIAERPGLILIGLGCILLACGAWGCEKQPNDAESSIDLKPLAEDDREAPAPEVTFPEEFHTGIVSLDDFIRRSMRACAEGDYDTFRSLFDANYAPPGLADFERIWRAVAAIELEAVYRGTGDPPEAYFLHVRVRRRQKDAEGRLERDVVVMVFRTADEWRLGPAPKEIMERIRAADSRPADADSAASEPAMPDSG